MTFQCSNGVLGILKTFLQDYTSPRHWMCWGKLYIFECLLKFYL